MKERDKQHVKTVPSKDRGEVSDDVKMACPGTNKNADFSALKVGPMEEFFCIVSTNTIREIIYFPDL